MSSNVRGLREERLVDIKDEITSDTSVSDEVNVVYDDDDDEEEEEIKDSSLSRKHFSFIVTNFQLDKGRSV
jgi:hypothetical protein